MLEDNDLKKSVENKSFRDGKEDSSKDFFRREKMSEVYNLPQTCNQKYNHRKNAEPLDPGPG